MKNKKLAVLAMATGLSVLSCIPAFAGQWKQDNIGWWYQEDNGSYPVSTWKWIDGNGDGVAECYYFNASGYMISNTSTPDSYSVNNDGAWTVNGIVQTKQVGLNDTSQEKTGSALFEDRGGIGGSTGAQGTLNGSSQSSSGDYDGMSASGNSEFDLDGDGKLTGHEYELYMRMKDIKQDGISPNVHIGAN